MSTHGTFTFQTGLLLCRAGSSGDAHHMLLRFILCMANDCFGLEETSLYGVVSSTPR